MVIEGAYGYSFERPVRHMREYLSILMPALRGESVSFEGETMRGTTFEPVTVGGASAPEVLVAALGPAMLELAGQMAGGTVTWMVGPRTLSSHIIPSITAASEAAGRVAPRIAVCLPVCVTSDPDRALQRAARSFALYNQLPSYRAMLDREDVDGPGDVALIGEEDRVAAAVEQLKEIGATDFAAVPLGPRDEWQRTAALMSDLAGRL
jgi:F420-dependent oxidoreductase-like protein